jgi:hypothetical protein
MGETFKCHFCDNTYPSKIARGAHLGKKHPGQTAELEKQDTALVNGVLEDALGARKALDGVLIGAVAVTLEDWQEKCDKADKWDKAVAVAPSLESLLELIKVQK